MEPDCVNFYLTKQFVLESTLKHACIDAQRLLPVDAVYSDNLLSLDYYIGRNGKCHRAKEVYTADMTNTVHELDVKLRYAISEMKSVPQVDGYLTEALICWNGLLNVPTPGIRLSALLMLLKVIVRFARYIENPTTYMSLDLPLSTIKELASELWMQYIISPKYYQDSNIYMRVAVVHATGYLMCSVPSLFGVAECANILYRGLTDEAIVVQTEAIKQVSYTVGYFNSNDAHASMLFCDALLLWEQPLRIVAQECALYSDGRYALRALTCYPFSNSPDAVSWALSIVGECFKNQSASLPEATEYALRGCSITQVVECCMKIHTLDDKQTSLKSLGRALHPSISSDVQWMEVQRAVLNRDPSNGPYFLTWLLHGMGCRLNKDWISEFIICYPNRASVLLLKPSRASKTYRKALKALITCALTDRNLAENLDTLFTHWTARKFKDVLAVLREFWSPQIPDELRGWVGNTPAVSPLEALRYAFRERSNKLLNEFVVVSHGGVPPEEVGAVFKLMAQLYQRPKAVGKKFEPLPQMNIEVLAPYRNVPGFRKLLELNVFYIPKGSHEHLLHTAHVKTSTPYLKAPILSEEQVELMKHSLDVPNRHKSEHKMMG